jgi:NitT/TauT family transport system permease protein
MLAARDAAKNIPKTYILSVRSLNASPSQIYRHVILPACLPSILSTTRVSMGFATVGLAITEAWAVSSRSVGLWAYVMNAHYAFHYSAIFAGILAFAILGILVYALIDLLERFVCRWNYVS